MKVWRCPKCERTVEAIATYVRHRCPWNRQKMTDFEPLEDVAPSSQNAR